MQHGLHGVVSGCCIQQGFPGLDLGLFYHKLPALLVLYAASRDGFGLGTSATQQSFLLCCSAIEPKVVFFLKVLQGNYTWLGHSLLPEFCLCFTHQAHTLLRASVLFNSNSWCWTWCLTVVCAFACPGCYACRTIGLPFAASLIGAPLAVCSMLGRHVCFFCSIHPPPLRIHSLLYAAVVFLHFSLAVSHTHPTWQLAYSDDWLCCCMRPRPFLPVLQGTDVLCHGCVVIISLCTTAACAWLFLVHGQCTPIACAVLGGKSEHLSCAYVFCNLHGRTKPKSFIVLPMVFALVTKTPLECTIDGSGSTRLMHLGPCPPELAVITRHGLHVVQIPTCVTCSDWLC